jgi:hypothetical protein
MTKKCSVCGEFCEITRRGMCNKHYRRKMKYGNPDKTINRAIGQGTPHISGYWMFEISGRSVLRHVLVAEKALGKPLPKGAQVHHVDYDRSNDSNENLVICQNVSYHKLLHRRTDALNACGNANWLRCSKCGKYSPASELRIYKPSGNKWHPGCAPKRKQT